MSFGLLNQKVDFDYSAILVNPAANWNASFARSTASLTAGEVAVAHVRLSGASAQGEVSLINASGIKVDDLKDLQDELQGGRKK